MSPAARSRVFHRGMSTEAHVYGAAPCSQLCGGAGRSRSCRSRRAAANPQRHIYGGVACAPLRWFREVSVVSPAARGCASSSAVGFQYTMCCPIAGANRCEAEGRGSPSTRVRAEVSTAGAECAVCCRSFASVACAPSSSLSLLSVAPLHAREASSQQDL